MVFGSCMDGPRIASVLLREESWSLALMCTAFRCGAHYRWPRWVPRTEPSSRIRAEALLDLLTGSLGFAGRPPSPSRVLPSQAYGAVAWRIMPPLQRADTFSFAHHGPRGAGRLVRQCHRCDKPVISGPKRYQPGIGHGPFDQNNAARAPLTRSRRR